LIPETRGSILEGTICYSFLVYTSYLKERSVIRKEDDVAGRASVTKNEERVLRGG